MNYINAIDYVMDRAKTQMNYYTQSGDTYYLGIAETYISIASIYIKELQKQYDE